MKSPKFLICNDFVNDSEGETEYLLHNHRPRFMTKTYQIAFDEISKMPEKPFADVLYVNSDGVMDIYRIELTENYDKIDEDEIQDIIFDAVNYYAKYLETIEKEDGKKSGYPVKDFTDELPGLKLLKSAENWCVVYNGLVADFDTEEELDHFLEVELEIEPELLDKGIINYFD